MPWNISCSHTGMRSYTKRDFPVDKTRRFLEPGPIVLVSSAWKGEQNIMTMGWHTVLEFSPALLGCMITSANHSFNMIKKSKECVINIPTADMVKTVVGIGNCSGAQTNKFETFGLTAVKAKKVKAPLIKECYAHFECQVVDIQLVNKYNFFILKVVKALVAVSPRYPQTLHYTGDGVFMVSGKHVNYSRQFRRENL